MIRGFLPRVSQQLRLEYLKLVVEAAVQVCVGAMHQHRSPKVVMGHTVVIGVMCLALLDGQHRLRIVMRVALPHQLPHQLPQGLLVSQSELTRRMHDLLHRPRQ